MNLSDNDYINDNQIINNNLNSNTLDDSNTNNVNNVNNVNKISNDNIATIYLINNEEPCVNIENNIHLNKAKKYTYYDLNRLSDYDIKQFKGIKLYDNNLDLPYGLIGFFLLLKSIFFLVSENISDELVLRNFAFVFKKFKTSKKFLQPI